VIVPADDKPIIGNSFRPGVPIPVISMIRPKVRPKITIMRIGEYLLPATTAREIKITGRSNNKVNQKWLRISKLAIFLAPYPFREVVNITFKSEWSFYKKYLVK
jgi:hypothetical protein